MRSPRSAAASAAAALVALALLAGCSDDGDDGTDDTTTTTGADETDGADDTTTTVTSGGSAAGTAETRPEVLAALGRVRCDAVLSPDEAAAINEVAVELTQTALPDSQTLSCVYRTDPVVKSFTVAIAPRTQAFDANRSRQTSTVDEIGDEAYITPGNRTDALFVRVGELAFVIDIRAGDDNEGAGTFSIERATAVAELVVPRLQAVQ